MSRVIETQGAHHPAVLESTHAVGDPTMAGMPARFGDYEADGHTWITLASGEYYSDTLTDACLLYAPVLERFKELLAISASSERLFFNINATTSQWMRVQLCRVFKRYVSPQTPVEMLKRKKDVQNIVDRFGEGFRDIHEVRAAFAARPLPDEALCALLWEYKDRGKKGYDLTERFFDLFRSRFPNLPITGPERAGQDIRMGEVFADYPNPTRPVDFVVYSEKRTHVLAIGLARYDGDRGGGQEDDRTGGYRDAATELFAYAKTAGIHTKLIFLNDGPGLLLGSMWRDYAKLESGWHGRVMITTLRMVPERITLARLESGKA